MMENVGYQPQPLIGYDVKDGDENIQQGMQVNLVTNASKSEFFV